MKLFLTDLISFADFFNINILAFISALFQFQSTFFGKLLDLPKVGLVSLFNGISNFVSNLMQKPLLYKKRSDTINA